MFGFLREHAYDIMVGIQSMKVKALGFLFAVHGNSFWLI